MGPRLVSRGKEAKEAFAILRSKLQWGRDLLVAERARWIDLCQSNRLLQWGRDLLVAERRIFRENSINLFRLQWGRDLLVAESTFTLPRCTRKPSFNGAATC